MFKFVYVCSYSFSKECYNNTGVSGFQVGNNNETLNSLIIQAMRLNICSRSESHSSSGVLTFLKLQNSYARKSYPNKINILSISLWNWMIGLILILEMFALTWIDFLTLLILISSVLVPQIIEFISTFLALHVHPPSWFAKSIGKRFPMTS